MKLIDYIKDHLLPILLYLGMTLYLSLLLYGFYGSWILCLQCAAVLLFVGGVIFFYHYYYVNRFLKTFKDYMNALDQKYLVAAMMDEPATYEQKELHSIILEMTRSMNDAIYSYRSTIDDFKEYIELWVHEVKIPLAAAELVIENSDSYDVSLLEELQRTESLVEQVLFYIRSENMEKDYLIKEVNLKDVLNQVIRTHRKSFIYKKIALDMNIGDVMVKTDAKWLEFILGNIIANSIKYSKEEGAKISVALKIEENCVVLSIEDNGIGIKESDVSRVFDKGFTGANGRKQYNSTGLGLYLCKSLCEKMNHEITLSSILNQKTVVSITFPDYKSMNMVKQ